MKKLVVAISIGLVAGPSSADTILGSTCAASNFDEPIVIVLNSDDHSAEFATMKTRKVLKGKYQDLNGTITILDLGSIIINFESDGSHGSVKSSDPNIRGSERIICSPFKKTDLDKLP